MKNTDVLVDTNILIDLLDERLPFNTAATAIFTACGDVNSPIPAIMPEDFLKLVTDNSGK